MCGSRKYPYPHHRGSLEILRGQGVLQSTRFTHERSTSNIHRLVHSSISFFEKFSDSANVGFYIRSINFVV